ncbi:pentatricopeptide repeat-containing protein 2, mitochondrial-like [Daphnia carinata]|uniref:pentatricopeptide repeat-containing protein 2, mitochondrial-like n=1 Tax=Daphnia carinata TaxID=120202 RepID=UPI00257E07D6|nr:pentatricopeptide repeat-containing protein 2, mitochondrial-like [Daphnia carinata]
MMRNIPRCIVRFCSQPSATQVQYQGLRSLYTAESLGLDGFAASRSKTAVNFHGSQMKEKFRSRMQEFVAPDSTSLIFTDDLKTMINLAEKNPEDIKLLELMIEKFHNQSTGLRFGTFVFGPVIMRFFHSVNQPNEVLALLRNPKTVSLFDQFMSYQIAMDLLLRNKMYNEVMEVFAIAQGRSIQDNKFPKNCVILAMAALYRMNTPESYEKMKALANAASDAGHVPMRRSLTYAAALALNQNDPQLCLNLLAPSKQQNYVTVRNLKALAFAKVGRLDDTMALLRASLEYDMPAEGGRKRSFNKNIIDSIGELVKESGNKDIQLEFARILKNMSDRQMIEEQSLEALLDTPIEKLEPRERDSWNNNRNFVDRGMVKTNFNKQDRYDRNTRPLYPPRRPGLNEME